MSDALLRLEDLHNDAIWQHTVNVYEGGNEQNCGMYLKHPEIAVYLRVSTDDQTVESQKKSLRMFLLAEGIEIDECRFFIDEGVSAKKFPTFDKRPAGKEMMKAIQAGSVKKVYGTYVNRFFRRVAEGATWMDFMAKNHPDVEVKTSDCFASTKTSAGRMMWHTLLMVSEMENEQRSERTQGGMQRLQENLKKSSHAVFGWFFDENLQQMQPHWHQQAVIRHVHTAWNDNKGQSFSAIARDLTRWGIKTSTGKDFNQSTVRRLVKSPAKLHDQLHRFDPPKKMISAPFRNYKV
jgi:DNA invertase Pin-like site-specific DNA recombinase